jgi:hypothetical protein
MVRDHNYPLVQIGELRCETLDIRKLVSILKSHLSLLNERSLTYWKKVIEREDNSRDCC